MGCQGSKTTQASNPVEQKAADTTLLKAPVGDSNAVKAQEPAAEAPNALDNESPMGVDATSQKAPEIATTQDVVVPDVAQTSATQDAMAATTVEAATPQDATTSKAVETPATQHGTTSQVVEAPTNHDDTTSKAVQSPPEMEAATPQDIDAKKQAADVATAIVPVVVGEKVGCCSRFSLAKERQSEVVPQKDVVAPDVAHTGAAQDATAATTVETPTPHNSTTSTAVENPATQDVTTPKAPEILAEMEAATPQDPNAKKQAAGVATANDEDKVVKQIPTVQVTEATTETEQKQSSLEPVVEAAAGKSAPVQDLAEEVVSADQAKVAKVEVVTVPVVAGEKVGCCSRFSLAKERQSEEVPQEDVVAPDVAQTGATQDATAAKIVETFAI